MFHFAKLLNELSEEDFFLGDSQLLNEYMEPESTLLCSPERTTGPCPEPDVTFIYIRIYGVLTKEPG
jgi:hypothetical protein